MSLFLRCDVVKQEAELLQRSMIAVVEEAMFVLKASTPAA